MFLSVSGRRAGANEREIREMRVNARGSERRRGGGGRGAVSRKQVRHEDEETRREELRRATRLDSTRRVDRSNWKTNAHKSRSWRGVPSVL